MSELQGLTLDDRKICIFDVAVVVVVVLMNRLAYFAILRQSIDF
jgi:hypothetical protein